MSDKLKELTERLYNEGLSKGKEEGERILAEARAEAEAVIAKAKIEAAAIVGAAEKQAEDLKSKSASDVRMASEQCLQATRKDIENLLTARAGAAEINAATADPAFIKELIMAVASGFSADESKDISLVLPAALQARLEPWVAGELKSALASEVKASFSKKIAGGFTIGPKDGSWYISLTDETFRKLISEYIRPVTRKLLFGE